MILEDGGQSHRPCPPFPTTEKCKTVWGFNTSVPDSDEESLTSECVIERPLKPGGSGVNGLARLADFGKAHFTYCWYGTSNASGPLTPTTTISGATVSAVTMADVYANINVNVSNFNANGGFIGTWMYGS